MTTALVAAHSVAALTLSITALVLARGERPPAAWGRWVAVGVLFFVSAILGALAAGSFGRLLVAVSTILGAVGMLLYHGAASAMVGRPRRRWPALLLAAGVVAALWFTVVQPNFTARSVTVGLFAAALLSSVASVLLSAGDRPAGRWIMTPGLLTLLLALAYAVRAARLAVDGLPPETVALPVASAVVYAIAVVVFASLTITLVRVSRQARQPVPS